MVEQTSANLEHVDKQTALLPSSLVDRINVRRGFGCVAVWSGIVEAMPISARGKHGATLLALVAHQSYCMQLTRAGNWRARIRNLSPTGLKHKTTCKFRRTCVCLQDSDATISSSHDLMLAQHVWKDKLWLTAKHRSRLPGAWRPSYSGTHCYAPCL